MAGSERFTEVTVIDINQIGDNLVEYNLGNGFTGVGRSDDEILAGLQVGDRMRLIDNNGSVDDSFSELGARFRLERITPQTTE